MSMLAMLVTAGASDSWLHHPEKWPCVMSQSFDVGSYGRPHVSEYAMSQWWYELKHSCALAKPCAAIVAGS